MLPNFDSITEKYTSVHVQRSSIWKGIKIFQNISYKKTYLKRGLCFHKPLTKSLATVDTGTYSMLLLKQNIKE